jgi:hypothetical protein
MVHTKEEVGELFVVGEFEGDVREGVVWITPEREGLGLKHLLRGSELDLVHEVLLQCLPLVETLRQLPIFINTRRRGRDG